MSKTLRRGGWGHPKYQHDNVIWWKHLELAAQDPLHRQWFYRKVYDEHWTCSPPSSMKKIYNRIDRRRWNYEATKPEPQLPRNHRRWGMWAWW